MENIVLTYLDVFDENKQKSLEFSKYLLEDEVNKDSLFVLRVDGESMQPVINHKALVVADLSKKQLENESIYIAYYENRLWIKKAVLKNKEFYLVSINKNYSHLVYKASEVHIVAKALLTFTKL
ncbi:S24 family peptidase [Malaciobacter mytili]|uniref:Peptidase n=1 Tax=Malaciobacter mytili LMG 24559 TaxID=1032238 RepID=A0AAX2AJT5_9BACT|nr:S24 family peptidase [Malaciobacter mytili]AXH14741.1 hypothetical protein AMYT_1155 [Malaciobacter mytili LMG 24559]RXK16885.1 peptidase [Malaciobacter mytili LMG 24559]